MHALARADLDPPVIFPLPASASSTSHGLIFESRTKAAWEARPGADAGDAIKLGRAGARAFIESGTSAPHGAAVPDARVLQRVKESQAGLPITSDDVDNSGRSTHIGCCPVPPDISMSLAVIEPSHLDYTFALPVFSD